MLRNFKKYLPILILFIVLGFVVFALSRPNTEANKSQKSKNTDIVSKKGIHWHPELTIYVKGQKQDIPANIGIGQQYSSSKWYDPMMQMTDIHTHDNSGVLHWEVMDNMTPVTKEHVRLGNFFDIWGKPFSSTQLFDKHNGPEGKVTMTVNGQPNTEFDQYVVHNKDQIVIRFE